MIVERIEHADVDGGEGLVAVLIRRYREGTVGGSRFLTEPSSPLQVGVLTHPAGTKLRSHYHPSQLRSVKGTPEVLIVTKGTVIARLYTASGTFVTDRTLHAGDMILLLRGGHGFEVEADAEMIEVKQGPFLGDGDKELIGQATSPAAKKTLNPDWCGMPSHHHSCTCDGAGGDR